MTDSRVATPPTIVPAPKEKLRQRPREIRCVRRGDYLVPRNYELRWFDENTTDGVEYWVTIKPLSYKGSAFEVSYHIQVQRAFDNMPENEFKAHFPTSDHFRHYLLCKLGYCTHDTVLCLNEEVAETEARKRRRTKGGRKDSYIITTHVGNVVNIYESFSQAHASTTLSPIHQKEEFIKSANAVLDYLCEMLGCTRDELRENSRSNA